MKFKLFLIALLTGLLLITSCSWDSKEKEPVDINELNIADDFNFETERWVNVKLNALYTGTFYLKDMNGKMLYKGTINQNSGFEQKVRLPTDVTEVEIEYHEVESVSKNYRIRNNEIVYSFVPQLR